MAKMSIVKEKNIARIRKYNLLLTQLGEAIKSKDKNKVSEILMNVQNFGGIFGFSEKEAEAIKFLNS